MAKNQSDAASTEQRKRSRTRSPNFPAIDLETAVQRVQELYSQEGHHKVPYHVAVKHWKYTPKSSAAMQTVGALNAFGLIEVEGKGQDRQVWLSPLGRNIIEDKRENSSDRAKAIQDAALSPNIHKELWDEYGADLPSDGNIETVLLQKYNFNPNSARRFIKEYKNTVFFAGLGSADTINGESREDDTGSHAAHGEQRQRGDEVVGTNGQEPLKKGHQRQDKPAQFAIDLPGEGRVTLQTPSEMSEESIEFLKIWLERCWKAVRSSDQSDDNAN